MGCNCKGNKQTVPPVDELTYLQLVKLAIIDGEQISNNQKNMLYDYYNQQIKPQELIRYTCGNCWDAFIKNELKELWTRKSLESQPN